MTTLANVLCLRRCFTLLNAWLTIMILISLPLLAQEDPAPWYETEAINPGLGAQPEDVDLSSPRIALRSFVDLSEAGDHAAAAHVLNLSHLPEDEQNARGAQIAAKLALIIERKLRINWSRIPAEADARPSQGAEAEDSPQPRRDYLVAELDADDRIYAIRLSRYAVATTDDKVAQPVWLFSRDTVDNVNLLHKAFGPRAFEAHIPDAMKVRLGWLQLWEWIALPLAAVIVTIVGFLTTKLVSSGRHLIKNRVVGRAFERATLPLSLVATAAVAHWLLGFIVSLSGPANAVIKPTLVLLAVVAFSLAALRAVDALLDHVTRRQLGNNYDTPTSSEREFYTTMYAVRRVILVITVGFSIVFVLLQFDIFADMGITLLASAGVLTVILGIAGQTTLGNMVASLQIAIAKPVRIGDNIHYEGYWCVVEAIYFTFIQLRTWDERRLIVPVKYFLSYPFKNWSMLNERLMITVQLVLDPMAEAAVLREKFTSIAKKDSGVIEHESIRTCITDHSAQGLTITFYAISPDPMTAWSTEMRLREELVDFVRARHPEWWWRERIEL